MLAACNGSAKDVIWLPRKEACSTVRFADRPCQTMMLMSSQWFRHGLQKKDPSSGGDLHPWYELLSRSSWIAKSRYAKDSRAVDRGCRAWFD